MSNLTEQQKEYLGYVLQGKTPGEIASLLDKKVVNVHHVLDAAANKMAASNYEEAAQKAKKKGLLG